MDKTIMTFSGRNFTSEEIDLIKWTRKRDSQLSRTELARTICEFLGWTTPAGRGKTPQCTSFLEKLEEEGLIELPPLDVSKIRSRNLKVPDVKINTTPITGELKDLLPIHLEIARAGIDFIAIDGSQKFMRTEPWTAEPLVRHVGKDKQTQYYVYALEAVVLFENGITLPLMSEFLNSEEYRDVSSNKQDCERKAFYRFAERIKKRFPKLKISVTMDGLYACGPVIKTCHEYGWDYMLVFKEGSMKDAWREAMGLIRLTPENIMKRHCGGRNQEYRWINDVEYTYGNNGRSKARLHVVICEETWEETSRTTGKMTSNSTRYVWISGKEITKTNVETRCLKIGRYRWKIENNFLIMKHQGYNYEHCFSYDWNAMVGFHHLMQIGRFINVLLAHSELLEKKVNELDITGLLAFIFKACTADVLDLTRISSIVNDESYQWRLAS